MELEIRFVKDALMIYEDAPSRKASNLLRNYNQKLIGFNYKFKVIQISIKVHEPLAFNRARKIQSK